MLRPRQDGPDEVDAAGGGLVGRKWCAGLAGEGGGDGGKGRWGGMGWAPVWGTFRSGLPLQFVSKHSMTGLAASSISSSVVKRPRLNRIEASL